MNKFILLCILAQSFASIGQDTLGISLFGNNVPDSVCYGSSGVISVLVENKGTSTFVGQYTVFLYDADSGLVLLDSQIVNDNMPPGDTTLVNFPQSFDTISNNYQLGGNIVVIWPAGNNIYTSDSLWDSVYVEVCLGTTEPTWPGYESLQLYPNPTSGCVNIAYGKELSAIESVRIFTLKGTIMALLKRPTQVDMSAYCPGVYLVEIKTEMGIKTFKLVRK